MGDRRRYSDRRDYLIEAVQKRRKKVREMVLAFLGGKCVRCGYERCIDALEIHHLESSEKDFGISAKGYTEAGRRFGRNFGNANSYVRIVIAKPTLSCSIPP
jgi:hypothetical protein